MPLVMVEGGYRSVKAVYMRNTGPDEILAAHGLTEEIWTLFDEDGRKCVCSSERGRLFFWTSQHHIQLLTVH